MNPYSHSPWPAPSSRSTSPSSLPLRTSRRPSGIDRGDRGDRELADSFDRHDAALTTMPEPDPAERARQMDKIRQVTQNFFKRAALAIVDSRVTLAPSYNPDTRQVRSTRWFQLVFDESDALTEEIADWVFVDVNLQRPSPMLIEIYLDTAELARNQTLVVEDDRGKRWSVADALKARDAQVVLERWHVWLDEPPEFYAEPMTNVYKKAVVLFRALYTYCRFLPTWQFARRVAKEPAMAALRPQYRVLDRVDSPDLLAASLYPSAEPVTDSYSFANVKSPAGALNVKVTYRKNCSFRIDDYEALVSSQLRGMDDTSSRAGKGVPGSLPDRHWPRAADPADVRDTYGSLSTFHHAGHGTGTSPVSALRAARAREQAEEEREDRQRPGGQGAGGATAGAIAAGKSSKDNPSAARRVSVSFQPFKAGALSSSPGQWQAAQAGQAGQAKSPVISPSPSSSLTRTGTSDISRALAQARNITPRSTSYPLATQAAAAAAQTQTLQFAGQTPVDFAVSPTSASPSPKTPLMTRYSSSFGHRRSRLSSGGSRPDDETGSASSSKRGSALLEGSAGSVPTDDDNISDFINMLEQGKDLRSFNRTDDAARDASSRRTATALSRYRGMRDSNAALGDSISSSMLALHRSSLSASALASASSSQRLSGVPPTLVGASVSTSSSPGKPASPHTPHTPAIPSRLSAGTVAGASTTAERAASGSGLAGSTGSSDSAAHAGPPATPSAAAIPIPTSPQRYPQVRRSSSAHGQRAAGADDSGSGAGAGAGLAADGLDGFDLRRSSLPLDDRQDLSLSEVMHGFRGARAEAGGDDADAEADADADSLERRPQGSLGRHARFFDGARHQPESGSASRARGGHHTLSTAGSASSRPLAAPASPSASSYGTRPPAPSRFSFGAHRLQTAAAAAAATSGDSSNLVSGHSGHSPHLANSAGSGSGSVSASASVSASVTASGSRNQRLAAPAASPLAEDDEPLLFTMSELGRRSLEDMRAGGGGSLAAERRDRERTATAAGSTSLGTGSGSHRRDHDRPYLGRGGRDGRDGRDSRGDDARPW